MLPGLYGTHPEGAVVPGTGIVGVARRHLLKPCVRPVAGRGEFQEMLLPRRLCLVGFGRTIKGMHGHQSG